MGRVKPDSADNITAPNGQFRDRLRSDAERPNNNRTDKNSDEEAGNIRSEFEDSLPTLITPSMKSTGITAMPPRLPPSGATSRAKITSGRRLG
jgi:hypothetical protein